MSEIFHTHHEFERQERERTHPLLRWLGGSVLAHALLLAALLYVPAVRDTFMLASTLSGFRVVSEEYDKTEVRERVVLINLAAQQLYYPYGYLQDPTALPSPDDPQVVAAVNPTPLPTPRPATPTPTPSPSPSPSVSPSPGEAEEAAQNAEGEKAEGEKVAAAASASPAAPKSVEEAEQIAKESGTEKFPTINTKPFEDLLKEGKRMKDAGEINLEGTIEMTVEADREEDGKLANVEITGGGASDPKLKQLAKDFVSALSDSQILSALKGTKHLLVKLKLDAEQIDVRVTSDMSSAEEAARMANGYNGLLFLGAFSKKGKDEEQIFKSVKVASEQKQIVLTFNMPRKDAGALLSKLLKRKSEAAPTS